jgi:DNA-binding transcriptional ArsR family regulator
MKEMMSETRISPDTKRRAIGKNRRLIILWMLSKQELSVHEISERVGSSFRNVSHHLNMLKKSGIVRSHRSGHTIYYQAVDHEYLRECPTLLSALEKLE